MRKMSFWKRCPRCCELKTIDQFARRSVTTPNPATYCKPCQRQYSRSHYLKHADEHNRRRAANSKRYFRENRSRLTAFLREHPCVDCGEPDPVVLEFDHVTGTKVLEISNLVRRASSWKKIRREMEKCEVRCANCHRRKTARQFGWLAGRVVGECDTLQ